MADDTPYAGWSARMTQTLQWLFGQQQDQQQQLRQQQDRLVQDGYMLGSDDRDNRRPLDPPQMVPDWERLNTPQQESRTQEYSREFIREAEAQRHALQERIDAQRQAQERGRGWGMDR